MITHVWLLQMPDGVIIRAMDEIGDPVLCCLSEEQAAKCAEYQNDNYDLECKPVKVELKVPFNGK